ncbi:MAG: two component transcriptional regulator, AraC family [Clostridia bacterium]|jgi:two-component system response regulator YesN|nr:two component transcriptional regulator, AraC family [Clostridia bacterium]
MLKTIIIDDEELIREGLLTTIDWKSLGYEVVGQASDGEEAIELIQNLLPDVIITDIRMPFMNGLELLEFIKPMLPHSFVVIISGHDEFQYAQKALQLGAYDYLLKPFDLDYFHKMLVKIKYEHTLLKKSSKGLSDNHLSTLQTHFIEDLIYNKVDLHEIEKKAEEYKLKELTHQYLLLMVIQLDNYHLSIAQYNFDEINDIHKQFYEQIHHAAKSIKNLYMVEGKSGDCILCLSSKDINILKDYSKSLPLSLKKEIESHMNFTVTIAISNIRQGIKELPETYKQTLEILSYRFIAGYSQILYSENMKKEDKIGFNYPQTDYNSEKFIAYIKAGNDEDISEYIDSLFNDLVAHGHNSSLFIIMFVTSIYVQILNLLGTMDYSIESIFPNPLDIYRSLTASQNIMDTKNVLKDVSLKVSHYLSSKRTSKLSSLIRKAKNYIDANYSSTDLTLQAVAEHVNMGVCYFSSVFKQETDETFINYVTKVRIEKAKELLATSEYKSYEVSYMVGYNNPTYFSTIFKKMTGIPPSQYKG